MVALLGTRLALNLSQLIVSEELCTFLDFTTLSVLHILVADASLVLTLLPVDVV